LLLLPMTGAKSIIGTSVRRNQRLILIQMPGT
jgi:hypothetical protein